MTGVNRTLLAFAAIVPLGILGVIVAEALEVGSWGLTGITVVIMFLVSLIDREGFYGPRDSQ
jgi:hypothetical protein